MPNPTSFTHERLDAVVVAEQALDAVARVLRAMPRGERALADQLRRAAESVYLNLCEGAGRFKPREKSHFYEIALASATESAGALRIALARRLASPTDVETARALLVRVVQMLTRLTLAARHRASG